MNCPPPGASKCPTGSSTVRSGEEHVSRMNDENPETQWASAAGDAEPWAWIDLQETCSVSWLEKILITWNGNSQAVHQFAKVFEKLWLHTAWSRPVLVTFLRIR